MGPSEQIQELFYTKIPITRALGVRVEAYDGERLVLTAPLEPNINHLGTAFGASLNALAVLSVYGLLWLTLNDPDCHIIIRESSITYDRPVRGEIRAVCDLPDGEVFAQFKQTFYEKGKARLVLSATIDDQGEAAARFRGTFVALRSRSSNDG